MDEQEKEQEVQEETQEMPKPEGETKFCKHCGKAIPKDAVVCTHCGRQVEELGGQVVQPQVVINNSNTNTNSNINTIALGALKKEKNKWVALLLCIFLGLLGGHKFYEGKIGMGILYIFTFGVFGIGVLIDFVVILFRPNPYYV